MNTNLKHRKTKSQQTFFQNESSEKNIVKVNISIDEQIKIQVPDNCPLHILNSLLLHKVSDFKKVEVIGFQSVSEDYNFDYRLSKSIGTLSKNITLNCLYKKNIAQTSEYNFQGQNQLNISSQYRINKYKICKCLSSGGFSKVFLVRNLLNGFFYAAKFMDKELEVNINRSDAIKNQFLVHRQLSHPYIVKMEQYIQTKRFYILIMEYCPGGELFTLLKHNRYMQEQQAKVLFLQTLLAIKYLHENHIIFRDIKPENILIDQIGNIKVADFGLAKFIRQKTKSYCGSVEYMAPQIVTRKKYSFEVDLYCMGALLYEILIGCPPFYNPKFTNQQTKYHIVNSQACFPNRVPLSDEVKDLISSLLNKTPEKRLGYYRGVTQILQHPWIGEVDVHQYLTKKVECPFQPNLSKQHFQSQKGNQGKLFFQKIQEDIKKCKNQTLPNKIQMNLVYNPQSKMKSKSVQSFKIGSGSQTKLKRIFAQISNENHNQKITQIKKKKVQQLLMGKSGKQTSAHGRSLSKFSTKSRSKSKQMAETLLINHKSYSSSKRNSVYKKFLETSKKKHSNRLNNLSLIYQIKESSSLSKAKNNQKQQKLQKDFQFDAKKQYQNSHNYRKTVYNQQKQNQNQKLKKGKKKTGFNYFPKNLQVRSIRQTFI